MKERDAFEVPAPPRWLWRGGRVRPYNPARSREGRILLQLGKGRKGRKFVPVQPRPSLRRDQMEKWLSSGWVPTAGGFEIEAVRVKTHQREKT